MENQSGDHTPLAEAVGDAFASQYYACFEKPEYLHKFYLESSVLSRPGSDGKTATSVTTLHDINNMLLSLDYKNNRPQILSVDSQSSLNGGVIVFVTGHLIGKDNVNVIRKFVQTFFLAVQDTGYFVLNDIFHYVDGVETPEAPSTPNDEPSDTVVDHQHGKAANNHVLENGEENTVTEHSSVVANNHQHGKAANNHVVENGEENTVTEHSSVVANNLVESRKNLGPQVAEAASSNITLLKDALKKSYASVANALNENKAPFRAMTRPATKLDDQQPRRAHAVAPQNNSVVPVKKNNNVPTAAGVKAYAIFVAGLPMDASVEGLEKVFMRYGPIKRNGIHVRRGNQEGTSIGFVEFESAISMQKAFEAPLIKYGDHVLRIDERRANGRFASRRGEGYRYDNHSGRRGNYNGGSHGNYGRNNLEKGEHPQFTGQTRGNANAGSNGESRQPLKEVA